MNLSTIERDRENQRAQSVMAENITLVQAEKRAGPYRVGQKVVIRWTNECKDVAVVLDARESPHYGWSCQCAWRGPDGTEHVKWLTCQRLTAWKGKG